MNIKPVTLAVVAALLGAGAPAWAADAAPATAEQINVTGIRASKQKSLTKKRNADTVTEVVTAEDVGKMPDKNVADALQRLPGVNTSTGTGGNGGYDENDRVSLRGTSASMSLVTLNGHSVASADWDYGDMIAGGAGPNTNGSARSVSFVLLPSELVSQVIVHKSAQADDIEGGVAGSIDIITRRPLEFKKAFSAEVGLQGVYADKADKVDPQLNALFNWKNEASTLGVMAQLFSEQRHIRRDGQTRSYGAASADQAKNSGGAVPAGTLFVNSIGNELFEQKRKRTGGLLDVQAKPTDKLTLNADLFYSKVDASFYRRIYNANFGNDLLNKQVSGVQIDNGMLTAAQFANGSNNGAGLQATYNPGAAVETRYYAGEFKYDASDRLKISGQIGQTRAEGKADFYEHYLSFQNLAQGYRFSGQDDAVSLVLPNGVDRSTWRLLRSDQNHTLASTLDKENFVQLDGEWRFDDEGLFHSVKAGLRGANHVRQAFRPLKAGWPMNAAGTGQVDSGLPLIDWNGGTYPGDYGDGLGGSIAGGIPSLSPAAIQQWSQANLNHDPVFNKPASGPFKVEEENRSAYVMTRFGGERWRANLGLRYVRTSSEVTTNTGLSCGVAGTKTADGTVITYGSPLQASECAAFVPPGAVLTTGTRFNNFYTKTTSNRYSELLPSFNLTIDASDDVVLRGAVAKTMSRPEYSALGVAIGNFQYNSSANPASTASGGNPKLKPIVAKNFNLGVEWYFKPRSALSAQWFYIDFDSLIGAGTSVQYLFNTAANDPATGAPKPRFMDTTVTQPISVTGVSQGVEFGYEQPIWGDFGVNANYTYADSKEASGNPILGAAKNTYNLGLYYETDRFNVRGTYAHRNDVRIGLYGAQQTYAAASGTFNASASYNVTDALTLTFEGLNLNNPKLRYYNKVPGSAMPEQTTALYQSGRQYYFGLRYKY